MSGFIAKHKADDKIRSSSSRWRRRWAGCRTRAVLMQHAMKNPDEAGAAATDLCG